MGHMTNVRASIQLTNKLTPAEQAQLEMEIALDLPCPHLNLRNSQQVTYSVIAFQDLKGLICTSNLPGWFPIQSFKGNNYIFLLYDCNSNAILVLPI